MTQVLVLYYSMYGHISQMAHAVADGARQQGARVTVKQVPETIPADVLEKMGAPAKADDPIASPAELENYDAIIIGTPTRFGNMAGQMRNFVDQLGGLWFQDKLVGKVGAAFTSSGSQHGGQETTLTSIHTSLFHLGLVVVGLPYSDKRQMAGDHVTGGSPYGATTIAGDGSRQPSANELGMARFQGAHVTDVAGRLIAGGQERPGFVKVS